MALKIGLEQEHFLLNANGDVELNIPRGLPTDGCGWLVEMRGQPDYSPRKAVLNLIDERERIERELPPGILLSDKDSHIINMATRRALAHSKHLDADPVEEECLYRTVRRSNSLKAWAGLHIHFSMTTDVKGSFKKSYRFAETNNTETVISSGSVRVHQPINIPTIVKYLDNRFTPEIGAAGRQLGLYRIKPYGFEYRSLPTSILKREYDDLHRMIVTLEEVAKLVENAVQEPVVFTSDPS